MIFSSGWVFGGACVGLAFVVVVGQRGFFVLVVEGRLWEAWRLLNFISS